jgi:hypothetical protein
VAVSLQFVVTELIGLDGQMNTEARILLTAFWFEVLPWLSYPRALYLVPWEPCGLDVHHSRMSDNMDGISA